MLQDKNIYIIGIGSNVILNDFLLAMKNSNVHIENIKINQNDNGLLYVGGKSKLFINKCKIEYCAQCIDVDAESSLFVKDSIFCGSAQCHIAIKISPFSNTVNIIHSTFGHCASCYYDKSSCLRIDDHRLDTVGWHTFIPQKATLKIKCIGNLFINNDGYTILKSSKYTNKPKKWFLHFNENNYLFKNNKLNGYNRYTVMS